MKNRKSSPSKGPVKIHEPKNELYEHLGTCSDVKATDACIHPPLQEVMGASNLKLKSNRRILHRHYLPQLHAPNGRFLGQ